MKRRDWIWSVSGAAALNALAPKSHARELRVLRKKVCPDARGSFAIDGNKVRFFHPSISRSFSMLMLADTHLFRDDDRGEAYRQYSARMAKAYNQTKHFQTGEATHPEACFTQSLALAADMKVELVALVGDIFSFPSEAAVDWTMAELKKAGLPFTYTAGNHDWHYEGMEGSLEQLRATWTLQRLMPMYQKEDPMMGVRDIEGVRLITIDNSNYEILPAQLAFLKQQIAFGKPLVLMVHIPLYAPGRPVGFGCGHPKWGAATDRSYQLERRPCWPEAGHTQTTKDFYEAVFRAPNLMGILAGHIHKPSLDVLHGIPQIVTDANATGACLHVEFLPSG